MGCQRCGLAYDAPQPHCIACSRWFNSQGLCAQCGQNERKPPPANGSRQSKYCTSCQAAIAERTLYARASQGRRYRGQDSRENVRETKHGPGG